MRIARVLALASTLVVLASPGWLAPPVQAEGDAKLPTVQVYKSPTCGCCGKWIDHLKAKGFDVQATDVRDVSVIKRQNGLPPALASCHTAVVGGYVIEGHVPADDIKRLLSEKPEIAGLSVPKMPIGSPGMEGPNPERYDVIAFDGQGKQQIYATHGP